MMLLLKMWLRKDTTCLKITLTLGKPATELNMKGQATTGKHGQRLWNRTRVTGGFQWRTRHRPASSSWIMILRRFWALQCLWWILQLRRLEPLSRDMHAVFGEGKANFPSLSTTAHSSGMEQWHDYPWVPHISNNSFEDSTKNSSKENHHHDQRLQAGFGSCCSGVKKVKKGDSQGIHIGQKIPKTLGPF